MKRICLTITFLLFITLIVPIYASDEETLYIDGNKVEKIFAIKNGELTEITIEEYKKITKVEEPYGNLVTDHQNDEINPNGLTDDWYRYDETGYAYNHLFTSERKRVSTVVYNDTLDPMQRELEYSSSTTHSFSIGLNSDEISAIKSGATFSWNSSAKISDKNVITINPGHYGWFEFAPYKMRTWGTVKRFSWLGELLESKSVIAYSPQKLPNGNLDGILYAITSTEHP